MFFDISSLVYLSSALLSIFFFFFNDTATTEIYTLSLHDALPTSVEHRVSAVIPRDRPDLDRAVPGGRVLGRDLDGLVQIGAVDYVIAGDLLLGLGERTVTDQEFA